MTAGVLTVDVLPVGVGGGAGVGGSGSGVGGLGAGVVAASHLPWVENKF